MPWRANNSDDVEAVERHAAFQIGIFSDPVYATGDWPQILLDTLPEAWLPRFTDEEKKELLGLSLFSLPDYICLLLLLDHHGGHVSSSS